VFGKHDGKFLHVSIDNKGSVPFNIPCEPLREIVIGEPCPNPTRDDYRWEGPDATFIRVPESGEWLGWMKAKSKSFVDVDLQLKNYPVPPEDATVFSVGFPGEKMKPLTDRKGLSVRFMTINLGRRDKLKPFEDNGFQYLEFPVQLFQPNLEESMPYSFKGISGGGVWCYRLLKAEDEEGNVKIGFDTALLSGVNFMEEAPHLDPEFGESRTVRCHSYNVLEHLQQRLKEDSDGENFDDFVIAPAA